MIEIEEFDQIWPDIRKLEETADSINRRYGEADKEIFERFEVDLISPHTVEDLVKKAKSTLVGRVIANTLQKHGVKNVRVPSRVCEKWEEQDFDSFKEIEDDIRETYVNNANDIAYSQILKEAKKLLPYNPHEAQILQGRNLILRIFWTYEFINHDSIRGISALQKLMDIHLHGVEASRVENSSMAVMVDNFRVHGSVGECAQARKYYFDDGTVESLRIYKNGKFVVRFHTKTHAEEMAKVLFS